uniref:Uncharacterized protein n=1 Tax=Anguilla anguilla TaxID=7936 RepID=A0A0E9UMH9_ANGAN
MLKTPVLISKPLVVTKK